MLKPVKTEEEYINALAHIYELMQGEIKKVREIETNLLPLRPVFKREQFGHALRSHESQQNHSPN